MIIETQISERLVRHYSDNNKMMLQNETGVKYADAIDVIPCRFTYTETDEDIPTEDIDTLNQGGGDGT